MNLANKLTVLRVLLVPVFLVLLMVSTIPHNLLLALVVFAAACITDLFDGRIARKRGLVTDFGKFMDPLADKILVISAAVAFVDMGYVSSVAVIIIIAREFLVTSLRLVASAQGCVIAADKLGKWKTISQTIWINAVLFMAWLETLGLFGLTMKSGLFYYINIALVVIVVLFTVISGANYLIRNIRCISTLK